MGLFDELTAKLGGVDVDGLASRFGLDPDQVKQVVGTLAQKVAGEGKPPEQATGEAAAETGVPHETIQAMLPQLMAALGGGDGLAAKLGGLGKSLFG